ncbi:MAG: 7-cyano-7-deazaguanine synthase [Anaerolineaceae bacterium]|nr:7-cyano-7-deazaguanine synthase [Anaerolineaceae bacterium]
MMPPHSKNVLVLASGGLDSTACIAYYLKNGYTPEALWVDYGHPSARQELEAISSISGHYEIRLRIVRVSGIHWNVNIASGKDEFVGRNSILASIGLSSFVAGSGLVVMGIHADTIYSDCSIGFQNAMSHVATIVSNGRIALDFPFHDWTKREIVEFCKLNKVPTDLTYSCLSGAIPPCGICSSCQDRTRFGV